MAYIESIPSYENNIKNATGEEDKIILKFFSERLIKRLLDLPYWCDNFNLRVKEKLREWAPYTMFLPQYEVQTIISGHFFYWNIMEVLKIIAEEAEKQRSETCINFNYRRFWSVEWDKEGDSRGEDFILTLYSIKNYDKAKGYIRDRLGITSPKDLIEKARDYERQAREFRDRCIAAQEVPLNSTIMHNINHNKEVTKLDMKANHYKQVARDREKRLEELKGIKKQWEVTPPSWREYIRY